MAREDVRLISRRNRDEKNFERKIDSEPNNNVLHGKERRRQVS